MLNYFGLVTLKEENWRTIGDKIITCIGITLSPGDLAMWTTQDLGRESVRVEVPAVQVSISETLSPACYKSSKDKFTIYVFNL